MSGIAYVFPFRADLDKAIKKTYLDTIFATNDNAAHQFDVQLFRGNTVAQLPEGTAVNGYFIRYSDNATVPLTGSVSGSAVSVTLTRACYNKPGQFALIIKAVTSGVVSTVFYGEGTVFVSSTDTQVDEENIIPSLDDLLAQIAVMEAGTQAANTAAGNANTAASNADTAADNANTAAGNANAAAGSANDAAARIDGMTVSAQTADAADAVVSDVDGVKHIAFSIPKGDPGTTPAITFQAATGAAGSDVILEQSGTAENPVVKLTIPRGVPGTIENVTITSIDGLEEALDEKQPVGNYAKTVNNIAPDANGNIDLGELGGGDGTVTAVNGEAPDENGNVQLDAQKVGALSSDPNEGSGEDPELGSVPSNADQLGGLTYQMIVDMIYPIGRTITTLSDDDNPNTLYPWQVWEQTAKGRMIIGTGANEANTDTTYGSLAAGTVNRTLGEMGGEAAHALTEDELPSINGTIGAVFDGGTAGLLASSSGVFTLSNQKTSVTGVTAGNNTRYEKAVLDFGGDQPHNNMPPYIAANIWKRVS